MSCRRVFVYDMLCCEVLKPCVILVVNREEVVGCVDCFGECHGLMNGVVLALVCVVAKFFGITVYRCGEVFLIVLKLSLVEIVSINYVCVELCEV